MTTISRDEIQPGDKVRAEWDEPTAKGTHECTWTAQSEPREFDTEPTRYWRFDAGDVQ